MFSKFDTNPQSDELTAADLYDAQGEWEAEQYEAEMEDDPYDGEMWEDAYDDDPADMYVWDSDLHNEF
jgi:hypothetical protein